MQTLHTRLAGEFTPKEWETYKRQHPGADIKNHTILKPGVGKPQSDEVKPEGNGNRQIKSPDGGEPHHVLSAAGGNTVFLSSYTTKHIGAHFKPGKGSVFSGKMDMEALTKAISGIPAKFFDDGGGAYEIEVPNAGFDLVQKPSDILKKYPNARKITVPKQEGVEMEGGKPKLGPNGKPILKYVQVSAYVVDGGEEEFATNKMTVVARPANPQFLPEEAKNDDQVKDALDKKKGFAVLTAFPGRSNVPKASEWGEDYAIIVPNNGKGADEDVIEAMKGDAKRGSNKLSFREALIRLASEHPELRKHLVPLLREVFSKEAQ